MRSSDGLHSETGYNNRLLPEGFKLIKADSSLSMDKTYDYFADGNLKKLDDLRDNKFDRVNKYDHLGSIKESMAGTLARGETSGHYEDRPYTQTYNYDGFGQLKGRNGAFWNTNYDYSFTYVNNRVTAYTTAGASRPELVWQYDADGRELTSYTDYFRRGDQVYDAAGGLTKIIDYALTGSTPMSEAFRHQDGDGREAKRTNRIYNTTTSTWEDLPARYYIASSVLNGEVVSDVDETGRKLATNIFASGRMIARQMITYSTTAGDSYQVEWKNQDSYALSDLRTRKHASSPNIDGAQYAPMELDPAGTELSGLMPEGGGGIDPEIPELDPNGGGVDGQYYTGDPGYYRRGLGGSGSPGCAINGSLIDCSRIRYADGFGNGIFSSLERAVRESVRQTGRNCGWASSKIIPIKSGDLVWCLIGPKNRSG